MAHNSSFFNKVKKVFKKHYLVRTSVDYVKTNGEVVTLNVIETNAMAYSKEQAMKVAREQILNSIQFDQACRRAK